MTCKINKTDCIPQGDTYDLSYGVTGATDLTDWTCYLQVTNKVTGQLTAIDREVVTLNDDNSRFLTTLTSAETGALALGTYVVGAQMTNTITGESGEILLELTITKQWVNRP